MGNIVNGSIIGVGESIGYISPLLGEGIVPALESAEKLFFPFSLARMAEIRNLCSDTRSAAFRIISALLIYPSLNQSFCPFFSLMMAASTSSLLPLP